jgi:hypothetical protein
VSATRRSSAAPAARTLASSASTRGTVLGRERVKEAGLAAEDAIGGQVSLEHAQAGGVEHQHRLARHLEQEAVARLGLAQAAVFALHGLLRLDEPLLQRGQQPEIAQEHDDAALGPERVGGAHHRHGGVVRLPQVDVAPARDGVRGRVGQHVGDLAAALVGHGAGQASAEPSLPAAERRREVRVAEGHVPHHSLRIHHERGVGRRGDEAGSGLGIHVPQRLAREVETQHQDVLPRNCCGNEAE